MCGISGLLDFRGVLQPEDLSRIGKRMGDTLTHRGPDHGQVWSDAEPGIVLAFRRLSILDLSELGHQPMQSESGRFVVIYNGEIYNFREIRQELGCDIVFRGESDTEILLAAIEKWGLKEAIRRANGMFALALWDKQTRTLSLARDRFGQKPLYFGHAASVFAFASELKAFGALPSWNRTINRDALSLYFRHGYIPEPHSIWQGVRKIEPGTIVTVNPEELIAGKDPVPEHYWDVFDLPARQQSAISSFGGIVDELDTLLQDAISKCMVSDVPLGAFLSGGIDSSLVVALMQAQSGATVNTFTIGFSEAAYNEAHHAAAVAKHLGCNHHELYISPADARSVIPQLPAIYDEPFSDSSQIPTFLVSRFAREQVTVSLSGDGGDELFAGYNRYIWAARIRSVIEQVPHWARATAAASLTAVPTTFWDNAAKVLPSLVCPPQPGDKAHKFADIMSAENFQEAYRRMTSVWTNPDALVIGGIEPETTMSSPDSWQTAIDPISNMMVHDAAAYLPGDILTKVDRASMAVSLESRAPLLDHRVAEFAWSLPDSCRMDSAGGKRMLREVLYRYVPRDLIDRPKMGFGVPVGEWMRGELSEWAEELITETRLKNDGFLEPSIVRDTWAQHLSGRRNWQHRMWSILMFQAWLDEWNVT
ncbi:MAG: asparagine synthase (glutamine-hydrolyzing) [Rhodospirillales bacterium]|jgi:asparagine synthase (glutamine-hydrolysing)|nr:asparagine synthase (glutamine-hydrolyzing) [Rhodospirillales bacterium]MBT4626110.1 asparagine synthase (glutamine-hydrolyzing) [Rhodospirillales bacterium]MBT5522250.1 asparagine synthase (glutamine-hydrolyzing) [Rhodospirillales bacterium]MBT6109369.1 asparagine synthase (glutamine-hydrolyzing) [Rhodospirillales bacterium]MBT7777631.1 asparagine synthase (glutamine-hydrolyzing) [Rhodospirillales bacterium]